MADSAAGFDESDALSSHSVVSSDDDAVNTEDARVYFGPVQSPEKKFATRLGNAFRTPLRRSARTSAAPVTHHAQPDDDNDEDASGPTTTTTVDIAGFSGTSGERTPLGDDMPADEPSSVLATKVLSACGNPSPPPSPTPMQEGTPTAGTPGWPRIIDVSFEGDSESPAEGITDVESRPDDTVVVVEPVGVLSPPALGRDQSDSRDLQSTLQTPEADLIDLNSFSTDAATPSAKPMLLPEFAGAASTLNDLRPGGAATVDDLLSLSPAPPSLLPKLVIGENTGTPGALSTSNSEAMTQSAVEEEQVLDFLTSDLLQPPSPQLHSAAVPEPSPHTPRRSTRPRRSRSPSKLPKVLSIEATTPNDMSGAGPSTATKDTATKDAGDSLVEAGPVIKRRRTSLSPSKTRSGEPEPQASVDVEMGPKVPSDATQQIDALIPDLAETDQALRARRRSEGGARTPLTQRTQRLGSLSPASADLLQHLVIVASERPTSPTQPAALPNETSLPPDTSASGSTPSIPQLEQPSVEPIDHSPLERTPPASPSPSKPPAASRTPARRIPVAEAIKQGSLSPQKPGLFSIARPSKTPLGTNAAGSIPSPVFRRQQLDDPNRSPAKRIPLREASMTPLASPAKGQSHALPRLFPRAASAETDRPSLSELLPLASKKARSGSADPAFGKASSEDTATATKKSNSTASGSVRNPLPFPIVAPSTRVSPIPEVVEDHAEATSTPSTSPSHSVRKSPPKLNSGLRQPSAGPSSRIPRIGNKPYARPKPAQASAAEAKPAAPLIARRAVGAPKKTGPADETKSRRMTIIKVASSSGSSSDEGSAPAAVPAPRTVPAVARPARQVTSDTSSLKRKREGDKLAPPSATTQPQPVIVMRKVVPGIINRPAKAQTSSPARVPNIEEQAPSVVPSPLRPQGPIKMRRVADWKRPQEKLSKDEAAEETPPEISQVQELPAVNLVPPSNNEVSPSPDPIAGTSNSTEPTPVRVESPRSSPVPEQLSAETGTRRSTRARRAAGSTTKDVFGTIAASTVRPLKLKPKPFVLPDSSAFAGMSVVALRSLTASNTLKNQTHVVELQTEVIRKEGKRPDSPTSKVRDSLERQKEERAQQRQQRAARRARRSTGDDLSEGLVEQDSVVDVGDMSMISVDDNGAPLHHRRGPGDEEDYVTPERPSKRELSAGDEAREEKRVKWDRGLATTVWLDNSPPRPKRPQKGEPTKKGCLATTAKSLRLDTLGNVLNADVPVPDLVQENIIVKKFVFEDDEDPDPPAPAPVAKITRSKGKKSKA